MQKPTRNIKGTFDEFLSIDIIFNIGKQEESINKQLSDLIVNILWEKVKTIDMEMLIKKLGLNYEDIFVLSPSQIFSNNLNLPYILKNLGYKNIKTYNGFSDSEDLINLQQEQ